jgi:hypothetical protein
MRAGKNMRSGSGKSSDPAPKQALSDTGFRIDLIKITGRNKIQNEKRFEPLKEGNFDQT